MPRFANRSSTPRVKSANTTQPRRPGPPFPRGLAAAKWPRRVPCPSGQSARCGLWERGAAGGGRLPLREALLGRGGRLAGLGAPLLRGPQPRLPGAPLAKGAGGVGERPRRGQARPVWGRGRGRRATALLRAGRAWPGPRPPGHRGVERFPAAPVGLPGARGPAGTGWRVLGSARAVAVPRARAGRPSPPAAGAAAGSTGGVSSPGLLSRPPRWVAGPGGFTDSAGVRPQRRSGSPEQGPGVAGGGCPPAPSPGQESGSGPAAASVLQFPLKPPPGRWPRGGRQPGGRWALATGLLLAGGAITRLAVLLIPLELGHLPAEQRDRGLTAVASMEMG
ncbi:uncharacterized protein LOC142415125 [Mycteria americana]|uniref:uncharacterized protein LOC142415125 n=1 Tax=Mycteria americana TaxID=33587 RepID=UPI003F590062